MTNEAAERLRGGLTYAQRALLDQALIYAHEHGRVEATGQIRAAVNEGPPRWRDTWPTDLPYIESLASVETDWVRAILDDEAAR